MAGRYDQAELLIALWRLGADKTPGADKEMMPTSHGILDRALESVKERLPAELAELTFSTTSVGLRCYELPDILLAAQEAMLTTEPNPTYLATLVNLGQDEAQEIAVMHGLRVDAAVDLGKALHERISAIKGDAGRSTVAA